MKTEGVKSEAEAAPRALLIDLLRKLILRRRKRRLRLTQRLWGQG
jgi:hypothetical protein